MIQQAGTDKTYNGWTNYETWAVKLWMDNDRGSYDYWLDVTRAVARATEGTDYLTQGEATRSSLATTLKDQMESDMPELSDMWADLLNAAFSEVNWYEIATAMLEDLEDNA